MAGPGRARLWPRGRPRDVIQFTILEVVLTYRIRTRTGFVTALSNRLHDDRRGPLPARPRLLASILPGP